jgi:hypothetical protein
MDVSGAVLGTASGKGDSLFYYTQTGNITHFQ